MVIAPGNQCYLCNASLLMTWSLAGWKVPKTDNNSPVVRREGYLRWHSDARVSIRLSVYVNQYMTLPLFGWLTCVFIVFTFDFLFTLCQLLQTAMTEVSCTLQLPSSWFEVVSGRSWLCTSFWSIAVLC